MTPLRLTSWFRRRMLALVLVSSAVAWLTVTVGYHAQGRREMIALCQADARHAADILAEAIHERPVLWRYDVFKFVDRIGVEWHHRTLTLEVHDARGMQVDVGPLARQAPRHPIWGKADVRLDASVAATVWVGADTAPLWRSTLLVALITGLGAAVLACLLYLVPVRAIRSAEQRISALMTQLALTQREEERGRIARDLHDGAGQALTAARLNLMSLQRGSPTPELRARLEPVVALLDDALDEVRRSTAALMPPAIATLGLQGAIRRHCEAFASASGLEIAFEPEPDLPELDSHVQTTCYRVIQEALTNIARHAGGQHAQVKLAHRDDTLVLTVEDDGAGIDRRVSTRSGSGLPSIEARAALLGGSVRLLPLEKGTRLEAVLPCGGGPA